MITEENKLFVNFFENLKIEVPKEENKITQESEGKLSRKSSGEIFEKFTKEDYSTLFENQPITDDMAQREEIIFKYLKEKSKERNKTIIEKDKKDKMNQLYIERPIDDKNKIIFYTSPLDYEVMEDQEYNAVNLDDKNTYFVAKVSTKEHTFTLCLNFKNKKIDEIKVFNTRSIQDDNIEFDIIKKICKEMFNFDLKKEDIKNIRTKLPKNNIVKKGRGDCALTTIGFIRELEKITRKTNDISQIDEFLSFKDDVKKIEKYVGLKELRTTAQEMISWFLKRNNGHVYDNEESYNTKFDDNVEENFKLFINKIGRENLEFDQSENTFFTENNYKLLECNISKVDNYNQLSEEEKTSLISSIIMKIDSQMEKSSYHTFYENIQKLYNKKEQDLIDVASKNYYQELNKPKSEINPLESLKKDEIRPENTKEACKCDIY